MKISLVIAALFAAAAHGDRRVLVADFSGAVDVGSGDYLVSAIRRAQAEDAELLIIKMDTPGGQLDVTREVVEAELSARVPVAVFVTPSGARAGSAGAFITLAAHVAAMAPASNIGAAHPVGVGDAKHGEEKETGGAKDDATVMFHKVENDTVAMMEGIAEKRGRNRDWAVSAVKESASVTAEKALALKVIDLLADDLPDLLRKLDGREVRLAPGETRKLHTATATIAPIGWTPKQNTLHWFANPELAGLLLTLGMIGLLAEFYHPGAIFPGVIGGVCLLFAAVGLHMLPVNLGGVLFLVAAVGFFVSELYVTGHGILAVAGAVCLVLGSVLLIDNVGTNFYADRDFGIPLRFILPIAISIALGAIALASRMVAVWRKKAITGAAGLVGEFGETREPIAPGAVGHVFVHGETWEAGSDVELQRGVRVVVTGVDGLRLQVSPRELHHGSTETRK